MSNQQAYLRFKELIESRQHMYDPHRDIRQHVLSLANDRVGFGYVSKNLETLFGANLGNVFEEIVPVDGERVEICDAYFALGTLYQDQAKSHKGAIRLFNTAPASKEIILFEAGFLATTHSWSHSFREGNRTYACLGYVYDDIAHYFMADYPSRIIHKLNSSEIPSESELKRADRLLRRIVSQRISKYNAQPMHAPAMTDGYTRRVLVCDQAYADASTVYGKVRDEDFERMLLAAISENPDAEVLVKTHPDSVWEKENRSGYYSHLQSAGRVRILRDPINPYTLFDLVDTVYVGTSQMGLEALFAGKKVVTFGAPFYAGWGLTDDRQKILHRHRTRSLLEIFHYFYVWYTIYHLPDQKGPAEIEDVLSYIEQHRPYSLPPALGEIEKSPKVSIILPVHGVEEYIEKCISSIQRQSLREIEIIPVNDASPDNSQEVIDRLASADPRIKPIVLSENVGQGFARNRGLDAARGEYVWFIDADDWLVDTEFLKKTVEAADRNGADMTRAKKAGEAVFDESDTFLREVEDGTEKYFLEDVPATTYRDSPSILHSRHFWLWLYRRSFLEAQNIKFVTTQWEERAFLLKALLRAKVVTLTTNRCTMYRIRMDSTARREKGMLDVERFLQNFEHICELLKEHGAVDRANPLRGHLEFQVSQFLHITFFSFWYGTLLQECSEPEPYLERISAALEKADFWSSDLTDGPAVINKTLFIGRVYQLITAALRARRFEWVEIASRQVPIVQNRLYDELLKWPADRADKDFQDALNLYARNERVQITQDRRKSDGHRPRIIIHIGATKTGSTFIQHTLEMNRPTLLRQGVWVPEIGLYWQPTRPHKQAGHAEFMRAALRGDPTPRDHIHRGLSYMGDRIHTIVLSSEAFFLEEESHLLADYFEGFPLEMVVYLRRQDEWANSQYCEFVAGGAVGRVDVPIGEWLAQPTTKSRLDYLRLLQKWDKKIGKANLHVRAYDRVRKDGRDLIRDFAEATKLPHISSLPRPNGRGGNEARLCDGHVGLLRIFNGKPFAGRDAYFNFISEVEEKLTGWRNSRGLPQPKPWMMTAAQSNQVMAECEDSNKILAQEYFKTHDQTLFEVNDLDRECAPIFPEEIEIIEEVYRRYSPQADVVQSIEPQIGASPHAPASMVLPTRTKIGPKVMNYGVFGWRLWFLTPIVAVIYARIASFEQFCDFLREPVDYSNRHWASRRPLLAKALYPQGNLMGPAGILKVWYPLVDWLISAQDRPDMQRAFRREPILFVRSLRSSKRRLIGRLLFPIGEIRRAD